MTMPLLPGPPDPPQLRCANPFCRKVLKHAGPGGYGPECARQRGLTPPRIPQPRATIDPDAPTLFDHTHPGVPVAKPLTIGTRHFKTKKAATEACQAILYGYPIGSIVTDPDHHQFLNDLLLRHHDAAGKIGCGVLRYEIRQNPTFPSQTTFYLIRVDGTETDFSFNRCITATTHRDSVLEALRQTIGDQVIAVVERAFAGGRQATCALTGVPLASRQEAHVDHAQPTFLDLATIFVREAGGWDAVKVTSADGTIGTLMADEAQREAWHTFHAERANLRVVSIQANLSLLRRGQRRGPGSSEDQA